MSREQWLQAALDAFAQGGVQAVRIDTIARSLQVARSGFYWHFRDRNGLLEEMKNYWVNTFTEAIADQAEQEAVTPRDRLRAISSYIVSSEAARYDLAFWSWARVDPQVAEMVAAVARFRTDHVQELIRAAGFEGSGLEARTRLFVTYHSWESAMFGATIGPPDADVAESILDVVLADQDEQS